jgi:3-dehydroquinate synthase
MDKISVSAERNYEVSIGVEWRSVLADICSRYSQILIIAPLSMKEILSLDDDRVFFTADGEAQKELSEVIRIWDRLSELSIGRKGAIIAIGGGATTDLGGFVASTWLRGIDWFAIPTTLAGMVDAAVGGKTGINTSAGKNLVGSFYSPQSVDIDLTFIETLSDRDFAAGLAEVVKTGLIADASILDLLESCASLEEIRGHSAELIAKSVAVKARVVSADFREGRIREILNFGHTFGHAVEKMSGYQLRHGEAVSIGTLFALYLTEELGELDPAVTDRARKILTTIGLPTHVQEYEWKPALELMYGDKKVHSGVLRFIGISAIENPIWLESVPEAAAKRAYERICR